MSRQEASSQLRNRQAAAAPASTAATQRSDQLAPETLQYLLDQAVYFQMFATPGRQQSNASILARGDTGGVIGFRVSERLHRFDIDVDAPSAAGGMRAANVVGESAGRLDLRWMFIPYEFVARPDMEPPQTLLDSSRSQRFVMQEMTFMFGDGRDGFRSFGTGRTFPTWSAGRPRLVAAAIGNITEGFGKFRGHEGNFTLCGDLVPGQGFVGHIVVRVVDEDATLRTKDEIPPSVPTQDPEAGITYIAWAAQKGTGEDQENRFSFAPDGQVRGLLIPTQLKHLRSNFTVDEREGFRGTDLKVGEVIGREIGYGRGAQPGPPTPGTPLSPFQFEGVAQYSFFDKEGRTVGAVTTNVLEGRRIDVRLERAPGEPAYRFGFFGPVVFGSGCFDGAEGMFYGTTGSILSPPPGVHVITHFYVLRLDDPDGRFRSAVNRA